VLTIFGSSRCNDLPSKLEIESSINRTVDEVEKLIRQNSTLPRLSRRDIVDILVNITSKDLETYQDKETIEEARKIYQRALMVVLPYNAEDAAGNINELYTRPPIVQIVAEPPNPEDLKAWKNKKLQSYNASAQDSRSDKEPFDNLVVTHASEKATKARYKNHKETYAEVRKESLKLDPAPVKFTFNLDNLQKQSTVTDRPETTRQPVYQDSSSYGINKDRNVSARPSISPIPKDTLTIRLKETQTPRPPSSKYNGSVLSIDQWRYNAPTGATEKLTTSRKAPDSLSSTVRGKSQFLSTIKMSPEDTVTPTVVSKPEDTSLKVTSRVQIADGKQSTSIYVTPLSSSFSSTTSVKPKYSSTYNLNSGGFRTITTMRPEVMELLASIGLRPRNATNVEEVFKKSNVDLQTSSQIPGSNGVIHSATSGLTAAKSPSVIVQSAFGDPVPEIGKGMSNLTPDVQLLFQRFGLQTSNNMVAASISTTTPRSTTSASSYTNFKPLPRSRIKDQEMKEFLARFGLGVSNASRQKKSMPLESTERPSLIEAVPGNMRQILENIGLISRTTPRTTTTTATTTTEDTKPTGSSMFHVFKPHEVQVKDERQRIKINELLDMIRLVQEGKANATDVRKVADDLLATTKTLREGPDPVRLEEIIRIYNENVKNEVKRQQPSTEPIPTSTTTDPAIVATNASTLTGIKRFMISVLGTSEVWVNRIIHSLARIRRMLTNMGNRMWRSPPDWGRDWFLPGHSITKRSFCSSLSLSLSLSVFLSLFLSLSMILCGLYPFSLSVRCSLCISSSRPSAVFRFATRIVNRTSDCERETDAISEKHRNIGNRLG